MIAASRPTLILVAGVDPTLRIGGGERYTCAVARAARLVGFEPHIFFVAAREAVKTCDLGTLHSVWSPVRPLRHMMAPLHGKFLIRALKRFLTGRRGAHIIHTFSAWSGTGAGAAAWSRNQGIHCVSVASSWDGVFEESKARLAGTDPSQGFSGWLGAFMELLWTGIVARRYERAGYRQSNAVFVNYSSVRRLIICSYGADPAKVRIVPYTPETSFLPRTEVPPPQPVIELRAPKVPLIVAVSRHVPRKGLAVLLRSLAQLRAQGVAFRACLVGSGYLIDHHRRLARELGLDGVVQIIGFVPESYEYLRHADLFVLPSLAEGSGSLSILEAFQAGVAVVASRIDGIPEDVTDGVNGLLVEPGNVAALASAIQSLIDNPELRCQLAHNGLETFQHRFSVDAMTRSLLEAYEQLLTS